MKDYRLMPFLPVCLCAALCTGLPLRHGQGEEPALPEQDVARLIRDLGSKSFEVRETATRRLLERETPTPELSAALASSDPEVSRRATRIINAITRREENAAFGRLSDLARHGEIDRFIEFLVRRPKWGDEEASWQVVAELNGKLLDLEKEKYRHPRLPGFAGYPVGDFRSYARLQRPQMVATRRADLNRGRFVVRAEHIAAKLSLFGLLVSSGGTRVHSAYQSIILAGGSVEVEAMSGPILVCAGDVKCYDASGCLIIARGDVRISGCANDCRIITSGSVHFLPNKVLPAEIRRRNVVIEEHQPNPLGFVKWFDPARVGVSVEAATGGVRVKKADAGKSFAAAGLRAGDLLTAIDGEALKSPDEFRLLLRAKLADGGKMALTVRRAGQDRKIPVRCKD
jgi:hypothetical protein